MLPIIYQTNDHPDYQWQCPPDKLYTCERPQRYSKSMKEYPQLLSTPWALFWFYSLSDDDHCDEISYPFPNLAMIMMTITPERLRGWQGFPKLFQWRKPDSHPRPLADLSFAREQNWPNLSYRLIHFSQCGTYSIEDLYEPRIWMLSQPCGSRLVLDFCLFAMYSTWCSRLQPIWLIHQSNAPQHNQSRWPWVYDWFIKKMLLNIIKINLNHLEYLCDGLLPPASPDPLGAALLVHVDAHLLQW